MGYNGCAFVLLTIETHAITSVHRPFSQVQSFFFIFSFLLSFFFHFSFFIFHFSNILKETFKLKKKNLKPTGE